MSDSEQTEADFDVEYDRVVDVIDDRDQIAQHPESVQEVIKRLAHIRRSFARGRVRVEKLIIAETNDYSYVDTSPKNGRKKPNLAIEAATLFFRLYQQTQSLQKALNRAVIRENLIKNGEYHAITGESFRKRVDTPLSSEHEADVPVHHNRNWDNISQPDDF